MSRKRNEILNQAERAVDPLQFGAQEGTPLTFGNGLACIPFLLYSIPPTSKYKCRDLISPVLYAFGIAKLFLHWHPPSGTFLYLKQHHLVMDDYFATAISLLFLPIYHKSGRGMLGPTGECSFHSLPGRITAIS